MARSNAGESVIERAVRLLDQFDADSPELTLSSLARRAALPLSTAHRLVAELVGHGLLERTVDGKVRIGLRLWEIGARSANVLDLREAARPFMEDLHAVVRQHVSLGVLDGSQVVYLERLSAPAAVTNLTKVAGRLPAHAVSGGQVLLAHASDEVREALLAGVLERVTTNTVTEPKALRRIIADVRRAGYAVASGQVDPEGAGVAAPVRDRAGGVVAALSVTVPVGGNAQRLVPAVLAAARGVSRAMGWRERRDPPAAVPS